MRILLAIALSSLASIGLSACKGSHANAAAGGVQFPTRIGSGEGDATGLAKAGTMKRGDGQRLMFDLQREPYIGSAGLWACWDMPAPTTALGRGVCVEDPERSFEITASFVDLLCRTNPEFGVIRATADVDFAGCAAFDVFAYGFEPKASIQVIGNK